MRKALVALLAATATCAFASSVMAADLPVAPSPVEPVFVPAPAWSWDGCYVGLNAGYGWGDARLRDNTLTTTPADTFFGGPATTFFANIDSDVDGFVGGGQIGCNVQSGLFVFGVEGDLQYSGMKGSGSVRPVFPAALDPAANYSARADTELDWVGTVRGRIGYAFDRLMVYATGGVAFGRVDTDLTFFDNFFTPADISGARGRNTHVGYTIGGGVEGMITENLSAKVEYLYVDLGRETFNFSYSGASTAGFNAAATATSEVKLDAHLLRAGLNYRFSW